MAGIAHPYDETVGAADKAPAPAKPKQRVSFSDLVEAWAVRDEGAEAERRYSEQRGGFETTHGEITDGYICEDPVMAIVLTAQPPSRVERLLLARKERIQLYTDTERLVRAHPEVAHLLHRAEVQYVSVKQALRGLSQRLLVNWLFVWNRDVMISAPSKAFEPHEIRRLDRELDLIGASYEQAASREAQIVYLGGMLMGVLALCALAVPVGLLLEGTDVPVDLTTFFGCVIAGALGALISVVTRMSADKFHVRHEVGRGYVQRVAAFRPFIGSVFGVLVYLALAGDVISGISVPEVDKNGVGMDKRFAFFLVFAFAAGFSERMVKEVLRSTSGDEAQKQATTTPPASSPVRAADATGAHRVPDA